MIFTLKGLLLTLLVSSLMGCEQKSPIQNPPADANREALIKNISLYQKRIDSHIKSVRGTAKIIFEIGSERKEIESTIEIKWDVGHRAQWIAGDSSLEGRLKEVSPLSLNETLGLLIGSVSVESLKASDEIGWDPGQQVMTQFTLRDPKDNRILRYQADDFRPVWIYPTKESSLLLPFHVQIQDLIQQNRIEIHYQTLEAALIPFL